MHNEGTNNRAVLMVSHDLHIVMAATNRVICLNKHICCSGTPHQVKNNPEYTKLFMDPNNADIAFYQHKHDHVHDISGSIVPKLSGDSSNKKIN
jgi:zinc transport system ATP-binding protein